MTSNPDTDTTPRLSFHDRMRQYAIDRDNAAAATRRTVGDIAVGNWRGSRWGRIVEIGEAIADDQHGDAHPATYSGTYVVEVIDDRATPDFGMARLFHVVHNGRRSLIDAAYTADMGILLALAARAGEDTHGAFYAARVLGITDTPS